MQEHGRPDAGGSEPPEQFFDEGTAESVGRDDEPVPVIHDETKEGFAFSVQDI